MDSFLKYPHLERFGNVEVEGIEHGIGYVFPKIDGTNASMWVDSDGVFRYGSRTRELSIEHDNAGFMQAMQLTPYGDPYKALLTSKPYWRLYGEWLVPHSLKDYRDDAWKKFYVFDVFDEIANAFVPYEDYYQELNGNGVDVIPCYTKIKNGDYESFLRVAKEMKYLLKEDTGLGEGCVIKNYAYENKFGRVCWAKIVLAEFKEKHVSTMGPSEVGGELFEEKMAKALVTSHLVEKEYNKIALEGWSSKSIPRLLETVYRCVVVEELYDYLKKNNGTINFKTLKHFVNREVKAMKKELF